MIDTRNLWQDENPHPEQLKTPTRARYADPYETILYNEYGAALLSLSEKREHPFDV